MLKKILLLFFLIILIVLLPKIIYYGNAYIQITNIKTYDSNLTVDKENNILYIPRALRGIFFFFSGII